MTEVLQYSPEQLVHFALQHERNAESFFGITLIRGRSSDELKRLYKRLALKLHPDKNDHPESGKAFQVLQTHFEATLLSFESPAPQATSAPPPTHQSKPAAPQAQHSAKHSQHQQQQQYPPPPPPRQSSSGTSNSFPSSSGQSTKGSTSKKAATHAWPEEDIPLPPDVFDDIAWDEWSDAPKKKKSSKQRSSEWDDDVPRPPPPPPPPQHRHQQSSTAAWPPPPPPPPPPSASSSEAHSFRQQRTAGGSTHNMFDEPVRQPKATASGVSKDKSKGAANLPSLELSDEEEDYAAQQRRRQRSTTNASERVKPSGVMPSLSDDGSDDDADEYAARRRARKKREEAEAAAKREAEAEAKRIATASKSLKHLFAAFDISDDEDDAKFVVSFKMSTTTANKSQVNVAASPTSSTSNPFFQPSPQPATSGSRAQRPVSSSYSVPGASSKTAAASPALSGFATCSSCGCTTVPISPFGDPSMAVQCHACGKFFVPVGSSAYTATKKKSSSSSKSADGVRCSCGKAKKGHCFMCGE
ncbi:DNA-J protein, putative [Bodo saltans]|uniref:DNA-J protein, putative n=1 Tax=Bodo saltans TaxID=75058 RepID=A0A0S4KGB7_BODSA|nr:DNA-J protein, putative [Bodo saltans]|eukprot:CUI14704.1 DNA-J protein, putative [Bodo saltans]